METKYNNSYLWNTFEWVGIQELFLKTVGEDSQIPLLYFFHDIISKDTNFLVINLVKVQSIYLISRKTYKNFLDKGQQEETLLLGIDYSYHCDDLRDFFIDSIRQIKQDYLKYQKESSLPVKKNRGLLIKKRSTQKTEYRTKLFYILSSASGLQAKLVYYVRHKVSSCRGYLGLSLSRFVNFIH